MQESGQFPRRHVSEVEGVSRVLCYFERSDRLQEFTAESSHPFSRCILASSLATFLAIVAVSRSKCFAALAIETFPASRPAQAVKA